MVPKDQLRELGLTDIEADVYLAVLQAPGSGAQQVAEQLGVARTTVYPALRSLVDAGLVDGRAGYGSRFIAAPPELALPSLIERQREALLAREDIAKHLAVVLADIAGGTEAHEASDDAVEILRDPRGIKERFKRLHFEATEGIDLLVKAPVISGKGNPAEQEALGRGVRVRSLYEAGVLQDPGVGPYIATWLRWGEQARVHPGELPCKLALFDASVALMPLVTSRDASSITTIVLRNPALGAGLRKLFDCLWQEGKELAGTGG